MKKLVATWIAVALSIGACAWQHQATHEPTEFEQVCAVLEAKELASCEGVLEPEIIYTELLDIFSGEWGTIHGMTFYDESRIFINSMSDENLSDILVHEVVHWVLRKGRSEEDRLSRCDGEALTRDIVYEMRGVPPGNWRAGYDCYAVSFGMSGI